MFLLTEMQIHQNKVSFIKNTKQQLAFKSQGEFWRFACERCQPGATLSPSEAAHLFTLQETVDLINAHTLTFICTVSYALGAIWHLFAYIN